MAKNRKTANKKQSTASWRKRGKAFEAAALAAREQVDLERRTGGSVSGLTNEQLFELQPAVPQSKVVVGHRTKPVGDVSRKSLSVERKLAANPFIPTVVKPPSQKQRAGPSKRTLAIRDKVARAVKGLVQHRAQAALAAITAPPQQEALDVWGGGADEARARAKRQRRPPEASTVSVAVVMPAEGASWNPTASAHKELLDQAVGHELERLRREQLHRNSLFHHSDDESEDEETTARLAAEREAAQSAPLLQDAPGADEDGENEDEEGEAAERSAWHVGKEKLTKAQRNRRERAKEREREERAAAAERKRERQLGRVGTLLSELKKESAELRARQEHEAAWAAALPKKLAGKRYVPKRPDVLLSEEQPSALRQMSTEGSLLADRFDSLQARHFVEVRVQRKRKGKFGPHGQKGGRRIIQKDSNKSLLYKSPHYRGPLPAWM
jgi:nucleolar protein 53